MYVEARVQPCCNMCDILIEAFTMGALIKLNSVVAQKEKSMRLVVTLCYTHSTGLTLSIYNIFFQEHDDNHHLLLGLSRYQMMKCNEGTWVRWLIKLFESHVSVEKEPWGDFEFGMNFQDLEVYWPQRPIPIYKAK